MPQPPAFTSDSSVQCVTNERNSTLIYAVQTTHVTRSEPSIFLDRFLRRDSCDSPSRFRTWIPTRRFAARAHSGAKRFELRRDARSRAGAALKSTKFSMLCAKHEPQRALRRRPTFRRCNTHRFASRAHRKARGAPRRNRRAATTPPTDRVGSTTYALAQMPQRRLFSSTSSGVAPRRRRSTGT